jgi:RND family efflux transporter MFP subunit
MRTTWVLLGALALSGCAEPAEQATPLPTPVHAVTAGAGPAAPAIRTNGIVANKDEFRLSFKVGGVIKRIAVNEGDTVRAGQRIAQIEQTEIDAEVEQARQAHEKALRDAQRGERLYADQVISLEQLQDLRTQTAVSEAALNAAQFNRSYAEIVAPHAGTVLRRLAEERELIAAGAPVLVLGARDQGFIVRAGVADREIVQLTVGDKAQIELDALPNQKFDGVVSEIASAADPSTGLFGVEVSLPATDSQPDARLRSGLVARLHISPSASKEASKVYVPIGAVVEGEGHRASVYVLEEGHARRREVQVAFIDLDRVALRSGLTAGERVITEGAPYLEDGEAVSVEDTVARIEP